MAGELFSDEDSRNHHDKTISVRHSRLQQKHALGIRSRCFLFRKTESASRLDSMLPAEMSRADKRSHNTQGRECDSVSRGIVRVPVPRGTSFERLAARKKIEGEEAGRKDSL